MVDLDGYGAFMKIFCRDSEGTHGILFKVGMRELLWLTGGDFFVSMVGF